MVLLHGGLGQTRHANAVATHPQGGVLPLFIGKGGAECFGVLEPQLKDVAHFNAAARLQLLAGVMATAIPGQGSAQLNALGAGHAGLAPTGRNAMGIGAVGSANEQWQVEGRWIGQAQEAALQLFAALQHRIAEIRAEVTKGRGVLSGHVFGLQRLNP